MKLSVISAIALSSLVFIGDAYAAKNKTIFDPIVKPVKDLKEFVETHKGFYVGLDATYIDARHSYSNNTIDDDTAPPSRLNTSSEDFGYAFSGGYRYNMGKFFVAPEAFYDFLNSRAKDFYVHDGSEPAGSSIRINYRYGGKMNFGYQLTERFSTFLNVGVAKTRYHQNWDSDTYKKKYDNAKRGVVWGVGVIYSLSDHWATRVSYDYERLKTRYVDQGFQDLIKLHVVKAGLVYSF